MTARIVLLDRTDESLPRSVGARRLLVDAVSAAGAADPLVPLVARNDPALAALGAGDVAIVRADHRSDEDLKFVADILWTLERRGVRCVPSAEGLVAAGDRLRTYLRLRSANVPTPAFLAICPAAPNAAETAALHTRLHSYPVVVKRPVGNGGLSTVLCRVADELVALLDREAHERPEGLVLLQPFVAHVRTLGILVAEGRVVSARATTAAGDDFRATARCGGAESVVTPSEPAVRAALASVAACSLSAGRVDLLETATGDCSVIGVDAMPPLDADDPSHREFAASVVARAATGSPGGVR